MDVVKNQQCKKVYPHIKGSNFCCLVDSTTEAVSSDAVDANFNHLKL